MKKIIAVLLVVTVLFALVSCMGISQDPNTLAKKLAAEHGEDISVMMLYGDVAKTEIDSLGDDIEGVYAVMVIEHTEAGMGMLIYCEESDNAEAVEEHFAEMLDGLEDEDALVKRNGKVVFVGNDGVLELVEK